MRKITSPSIPKSGEMLNPLRSSRYKITRKHQDLVSVELTTSRNDSSKQRPRDVPNRKSNLNAPHAAELIAPGRHAALYYSGRKCCQCCSVQMEAVDNSFPPLTVHPQRTNHAHNRALDRFDFLLVVILSQCCDLFDVIFCGKVDFYY